MPVRADISARSEFIGHHRSVVSLMLALCGVALLAGCASGRPLMPTPALFATGLMSPFADVPATFQRRDIDVLYVTDRLPERDEAGTLFYGLKRSNSLAFGSAVVSLGADATWEDLVAAGQQSALERPLELTLESFSERGRAPPTPMDWSVVDGKIVRDSEVQAKVEAMAVSFCAEVTQRLALTPRKEVFIYVHGIQNSFKDAVFASAELWHFFGREGLPIAYTWPAGGGGILRGYTYDRESGEFTVFHLKQFINGLIACPAAEAISIIAHSRGTDITVTMLREMTIAERAAGRDPRKTLRIRNVVLASPDMDLGVALQRAAAEHVAASVGRLTIYTSPNDSAISFAELLFGGLVRLGQLDITRKQAGGDLMEAGSTPVGGAAGNAAVITYEGANSGAFGHSYFRENPAVSSDLILTVRYDREPGAKHGRPLKFISGPFWQIDDSYLVAPAQ